MSRRWERTRERWLKGTVTEVEKGKSSICIYLNSGCLRHNCSTVPSIWNAVGRDMETRSLQTTNVHLVQRLGRKPPWRTHVFWFTGRVQVSFPVIVINTMTKSPSCREAKAGTEAETIEVCILWLACPDKHAYTALPPFPEVALPSVGWVLLYPLAIKTCQQAHRPVWWRQLRCPLLDVSSWQRAPGEWETGWFQKTLYTGQGSGVKHTDLLQQARPWHLLQPLDIAASCIVKCKQWN